MCRWCAYGVPRVCRACADGVPTGSGKERHTAYMAVTFFGHASNTLFLLRFLPFLVQERCRSGRGIGVSLACSWSARGVLS